MARPRKNAVRVPSIDDPDHDPVSGPITARVFEYMGPDADDDRDFVRNLNTRGGDLDDFSISSDSLY